MTCSFSRIPLKDSNYRPKDLNRRTRRCFDANETSSLVQCGWNSTSLLLAATMGLAVGSLSNSSLIPFEGNVLLDLRSSAPAHLYLYRPVDECSRERKGTGHYPGAGDQYGGCRYARPYWHTDVLPQLQQKYTSLVRRHILPNGQPHRPIAR